VLATDWAPEAVATTARNAERNGAALEVRLFRWDAAPEPLGPPWPLVLASDVLYEARNVAPLLALLPRLTAATGEVWLADPGRATAAGFLAAAADRWRIDALPHDGPEHVTVHRLRRAQRSR
jgi:predicted nicotinamide N-methyase